MHWTDKLGLSPHFDPMALAFGGGTPAPPPTILAPPPPTPPVAPVLNQTAVNAANKKATQAAQAQSGRLSTILSNQSSGNSGADKLGG